MHRVFAFGYAPVLIPAPEDPRACMATSAHLAAWPAALVRSLWGSGLPGSPIGWPLWTSMAWQGGPARPPGGGFSIFYTPHAKFFWYGFFGSLRGLLGMWGGGWSVGSILLFGGLRR